MTINASHRATTVRLSHFSPSHSFTHSFTIFCTCAAALAHTSLISDIALTNSSPLIGTISVYKPALLLVEQGIAFNSKCVSHPPLLVFCVIRSRSRTHRPGFTDFASLRPRLSRDSSFILTEMTSSSVSDWTAFASCRTRGLLSRLDKARSRARVQVHWIYAARERGGENRGWASGCVCGVEAGTGVRVYAACECVRCLVYLVIGSETWILLFLP
jgi:hypothetical protein